MNTSESDDVLVERFREHRDEAAFKELLERYCSTVHQLAASILGTAHSSEADDVVQEVFVRIHRALPAFRAESRFSTWLYRIAYNQALSYKSRLSVRNARLGSEGLTNLVSRDGDPTATLNNVQLRTVLDAAIDRLPIEYQMAVRLYYWFQLPLNKIALLSATSENTIKSYLHRARKLLANHLEHQREDL